MLHIHSCHWGKKIMVFDAQREYVKDQTGKPSDIGELKRLVRLQQIGT